MTKKRTKLLFTAWYMVLTLAVCYIFIVVAKLSLTETLCLMILINQGQIQANLFMKEHECPVCNKGAES